VDFYIIPKMTDRPLLTCTDIWDKELISFHRKPNEEVMIISKQITRYHEFRQIQGTAIE
jgi:hypothetical protein